MITDIFGWVIILKFTHVKPGELSNTAYNGSSNTEATTEPALFILLIIS